MKGRIDSRPSVFRMLGRERKNMSAFIDVSLAASDVYTPREMGSCALESISYADAVGDLTDASSLAEDRRF